MAQKIKIIPKPGAVFGKLTLTKKLKRGWEALCECGATTKTRDFCDLVSGRKRSCGCIAKPHGRHGDKIYSIWKNMRSRCNSKSSSGYHKYGAKGIKVCERWSDFCLFVKDMGEMPSDEHSIERIDVNGDYEPANCKWIPLKEQRWNTKRSRKITYKNITKNLSQWATELQINRKKISRRLDMGLSMSEIIFECSPWFLANSSSTQAGSLQSV